MRMRKRCRCRHGNLQCVAMQEALDAAEPIRSHTDQATAGICTALVLRHSHGCCNLDLVAEACEQRWLSQTQPSCRAGTWPVLSITMPEILVPRSEGAP